ncbi:hypothetical protein CHLRE_03g195850v5 [Chlamydomonas reinhardtii]|uniref:Peptide-methionine (R)-S-oxide reductase n=1 Tax=Chlamydomonas reinhardtii TaxID=3055 RepID=A0A2K3DYQ7_CHLRE|nr:uncharacterized protein CHLRE_03g195850v5 [Chlamydomonas reinhardtii]PNW85637.1 hypothetical protein CHLRE_03g195850v5 [Chlamydomonas reinhardtii]
MLASRTSTTALRLRSGTSARVRGAPSAFGSARPARQTRLYAAADLLGWLFKGKVPEMGGKQTKSSRGWAPRDESTPAKVSRAGYDVTPLTAEERQRAAEGLTDFQKYVTLEHGTERAFTGKTVNGYTHDNKQRGTYVCALGGLPLFSSDTKFNSGTGWPSFFAPIDPAHIVEVVDMSIPYMPRVEVLDARSGAHLGHVFDDGPAPTGKRYCINAAALKFIPAGEELPAESRPVAAQEAGKQQ